MKIICLGGAKTVTGSCFLLEIGDIRILVDCGMFQGNKELRERNYLEFLFNPAEIDFLLLTHAHIDHSGLIPRLVKEGFKGRILATSATADLAQVMLPDSAHIQEMEAEWSNRKKSRAGFPSVEPLYTIEDAYKSLEFFDSVEYNKLYVLSPQAAVRFLDAGHILGSAIIKLWITEAETQKRIVFSGDLGKYGQPIIQDPAVVEETDYLFMESTYGNRLHGENDDKLNLLEDAIKDAVKKGGNVIIPSFAVGRTQELLYSLNILIQDGRIPAMPIYIDSPMAISATEVFSRHPECFDVEMRQTLFQGGDPFRFPEVTFTLKTKESQALNEIRQGAVIISASGMCDAGRIKHHLKHNLWRPESNIIMVGYQALGSLGRRLLDGVKKVKIFGEEIFVRARIISIDGFSAHADQKELLYWVNKFIKLPEMIFLIHGEEKAQRELAVKLETLNGVPVAIPGYMDEIDIDFNTGKVLITRGAGVPQHGIDFEEKISRVSRQLESGLAALQTEGKLKEASNLLNEVEKLIQNLGNSIAEEEDNGD